MCEATEASIERGARGVSSEESTEGFGSASALASLRSVIVVVVSLNDNVRCTYSYTQYSKCMRTIRAFLLVTSAILFLVGTFFSAADYPYSPLVVFMLVMPGYLLSWRKVRKLYYFCGEDVSVANSLFLFPPCTLNRSRLLVTLGATFRGFRGPSSSAPSSCPLLGSFGASTTKTTRGPTRPGERGTRIQAQAAIDRSLF